MSTDLLDGRVRALVEDFDLLETWEDRIGYVIDLGRQTAPLSEDERSEATKVRGCASQVWIVAEPSPASPSALRFRGQSDAAIVQGLVTLLTGLFSDMTPQAILAVDAGAVLDRLGLAGALTAQRANGLSSMVARIRAVALAALTSAGSD